MKLSKIGVRPPAGRTWNRTLTTEQMSLALD